MTGHPAHILTKTGQALFLVVLFALIAVLAGGARTALAQEDGLRPWRPFPPPLQDIPPMGPSQPWAAIPAPPDPRWGSYAGQSDLPEQHLPDITIRGWSTFAPNARDTQQPYANIPDQPQERFSRFDQIRDIPRFNFPAMPEDKPWTWRPFAPYAPMP